MENNGNVDNFEIIGDGIIDPLYNDRRLGEELNSDDLVSDGVTSIESILDMDENYLDSFEKSIKEDYLEKNKK